MMSEKIKLTPKIEEMLQGFSDADKEFIVDKAYEILADPCWLLRHHADISAHFLRGSTKFEDLQAKIIQSAVADAIKYFNKVKFI